MARKRGPSLRQRALEAVAAYWNRPIECWGPPAYFCGLDDLDLIELDHRFGDELTVTLGWEKKCRSGTAARYRKAIEHPERFQLLCSNHHTKKTRWCREGGKRASLREAA